MFMVDYLRGKAQYFGTHPFIINLILVIGMSLAMLGFDELKRGGHRKVRRILLVCLTLLLISLFILSYASIRLHWKMITGKDFADIYWFIPIYVLAVASFPIALYLNRRQNKSTSQAAIDNAS
jgi:hypothetical protein